MNCPQADINLIESYIGEAGRGDEVEGRVYTVLCSCGALITDGDGLTSERVAEWFATHEEAPPPPQTCESCYQDFPADSPMIPVGDSGYFCSYECIAQWLADGSMDHCWTHDDLIEADESYRRRLAAIFAKREEPGE